MVEKYTSSRSAADILLDYRNRATFPLTAQIELTRRCNLHCRHCYLDLDHHRGLETTTYRKLLDELAEAGTLFVIFTGGEPTLRSDWLELCRYARSRGFAVSLMTNGTNLDDSDIEALADLPIFSVHISLYSSDASTHDAVTRVPRSFLKTKQAIMKLKGAGVSVRINSPVMTTNEDDFARTVDLAQSMGCDLSVETRICRSLDPERDTSELVLGEKSVERAVKTMVCSGLPTPQKDKEESVPMVPWPCLQGSQGLYVRADGEVWRCPLLPISFGSIVDMPVKKVWTESDSREMLQRSLQKEVFGGCQNCPDAWACHRCAAQAWLEHGSLDRPATIDCHLARGRAKGSLNVSDNYCDTPGCNSHYQRHVDVDQ